MQQKETVSIELWHELTEEEKEILRKWSVTHNFGLTIIPSKSTATCDYAALLTSDQLALFLQENNADSISSQNMKSWWKAVKSVLREKTA